MNKAVITKINQINMLFLYEENQLVECYPLLENQSIKIDDIYIGRVEKVVKNIQSAFIRLDDEHVGYLPLDDKPYIVLNRTLPKGLSSIAENDLILVQVEQEAQKMKQPRVTGNIRLGGLNCVLDLHSGKSGISKKIKNRERVNELQNIIPKNAPYGCILRTACENVQNEEIITEYKRLSQELDQIIHTAQFSKKRGCIYKGKEDYISILEAYGRTRLHEIVCDDEIIYDTLMKNQFSNVTIYKEEYPLCKLFSLETELSHILSKKVWLKSGGFLIIEPTEAMVVIDVNTGKSIGKKDRDKHILKINLEAAIEITRQIRLRNLSGIIMIDFINMQDKTNKEQIAKVIEHQLSKDKVPGYLVDITKLDIFELTRKKIRKPIHEILGNEYR